jgi:hypothetical protein
VPRDRLINRAQAPFPGEPTYVLLANRAHVVAVQVGLGARITDRWSVGAGVVALAVLRGGIDVAPTPPAASSAAPSSSS